MRTLTVKETAALLGVSVRTVQNRLNSGELSGKRTPNQYGVQEWRVWPNKEIMDRAKGKIIDDFDIGQSTEEFQGGDSSAVLEAETIDITDKPFEGLETPLKTLVREMTQQFAEQLSREKQAIVQLQRDLEEKDRQLKLLPDFQKEAEDRRKEAELKELEAIALSKQIQLLQEQKTIEAERLIILEAEIVPDLERKLAQERAEKERDLAEAQRQLVSLEKDKLEAEAAKQRSDDTRRQEVKALEERLASVEEYKRISEESQAKLDELQRTIEERNRVESEKALEASAIRVELSALSAKLELANRPWWKKWFTSTPEQSKN